MPGSFADIRQILRDMSFDEVMCGVTYVGITGVMLMVLALFG